MLGPVAPIKNRTSPLWGGATTTGTFALGDPNHVTHSWTMCHWKLYVPAVEGAVTVKLRVTVCPARTGAENSTRVKPHVELPSGLSEPKRYALHIGPIGVQSSVPVFFTVMLTGYWPPGSMLVGTVCEMT